MFRLTVDAEIELGLLEERHAENLYDLTERNRAHLHEWLPWLDSTQSALDSKSFIRSALEQFSKNDGFQAGIFVQGELAGMIGYHFWDWTNRRTEIGYWLGATYQGQGVVTRATRRMVNYALQDLELNRVEIRCATANAKSRAIPHRLGFVQEGLYRQVVWHYNQYLDLVVYSTLAAEWQG